MQNAEVWFVFSDDDAEDNNQQEELEEKLKDLIDGVTQKRWRPGVGVGDGSVEGWGVAWWRGGGWPGGGVARWRGGRWPGVGVGMAQRRGGGPSPRAVVGW